MANVELKTASGGSVTLVPEDGVSNVTATVKHESGVLASEVFALGNDLGVGQTWQTVTPNRQVGVTYTNNTGKPICVSIEANVVAGTPDTNVANILVDNIRVSTANLGVSGSIFPDTAVTIVPSNSTYVLTVSGGTLSGVIWNELR